MPLTTQFGTTEWETKEFSTAVGVSRTRASHKLQAFEHRIVLILRAMIALDPTMRECDLVEILISVLDTGGKLAAVDAEKIRRRARHLLKHLARSSP